MAFVVNALMHCVFVDLSVSCFVFPRPSQRKTDWKVFLLLRRKDPLAIKENRRKSPRSPVVLETLSIGSSATKAESGLVLTTPGAGPSVLEPLCAMLYLFRFIKLAVSVLKTHSN